MISSQALTVSGVASMRRFSPFHAARYTQTATATTTALAKRAPAVVENLFARSCPWYRLAGLLLPLHPCTGPSKISQKV